MYRYIHYIIIYIYHCILKQDYSCSPQHLTGVQNASGRRCKNPRTRLAASCKAMPQFMRLNQSKLSTCSDTWSLQMLSRCSRAVLHALFSVQNQRQLPNAALQTLRTSTDQRGPAKRWTSAGPGSHSEYKARTPLPMV